MISRKPSQKAPGAPAGATGTCDKCDGPHATEACPHFPKARESSFPAPGEVKYDKDCGLYTFACPHCGELCTVQRSQIFCRIFRHAEFKGRSGRFVNPHAPQSECERWVREGLIVGCGKPFKFDGKTVAKCGYI